MRPSGDLDASDEPSTVGARARDGGPFSAPAAPTLLASLCLGLRGPHWLRPASVPIVRLAVEGKHDVLIVGAG